jgi:hypothetical protein
LAAKKKEEQVKVEIKKGYKCAYIDTTAKGDHSSSTLAKLNTSKC